MADYGTLHAALAAVQANLPTVAKTQTADTGKYSYDYASLADVNAAVLPLLAGHGLTWVCLPSVPEQKMDGVLTHVGSGGTIVATWGLPKTADPQALGSAITYGRRYLLSAVVGLVPDGDDDGAAAQAAPADDGVPTVNHLRTRIGQVGERVHGPVAEWLAGRHAAKVADLDEDGRVALDVQLDAWAAEVTS